MFGAAKDPNMDSQSSEPELEKESAMTDQIENTMNETEQGNKPDWIAKTPKGLREGQRLERVGVAWNREDGGIGLRLAGKQVIENDIYLYPSESNEG